MSTFVSGVETIVIMHITINGKQIIGLDRDIAKMISYTVCNQCLHKTVSHTEGGCLVDYAGMVCECKKGYTSYLLLKDDDFIQQIIQEGLLV